MDGARFCEMFVLICQATRGVSQNKALFLIFFITFLEHLAHWTYKSLHIIGFERLQGQMQIIVVVNQ